MSLIVLAAGGTGGHVFPAMALSRALIARGHEVRLLTDARGLRYAGDFDPDAIDVISAGGLVSGAPLRRLVGVLRLLNGYRQARGHLRRLKPAAVVGFGGFPSAPPMVAAQHMGIPTLMHEQNGVMGRANVFVARGVRQISAAFPDVDCVPNAAQHKVHVVGNPIRADIAAVGETEFKPSANALRLFVFGGSQGAAVFARLIPDALEQLSDEARARISLTIQIREENHAAAEPRLGALGLRHLTIAPFFADMPQQLTDADVIVSRSGATTVHEIAAAGRPAIFVPLAVHKDDQQARNARLLTQPVAAFLVREGESAAGELASHLTKILNTPSLLSDMAFRARASALLGAADKLALMVEQEI